jgi:hypothetical protein
MQPLDRILNETSVNENTIQYKLEADGSSVTAGFVL